MRLLKIAGAMHTTGRILSTEHSVKLVRSPQVEACEMGHEEFVMARSCCGLIWPQSIALAWKPELAAGRPEAETR